MVCAGGMCVCVCVVSEQLTIEKDKLKEAQRLIRESEAKVGVLFACMALDIISHLITCKFKLYVKGIGSWYFKSFARENSQTDYGTDLLLSLFSLCVLNFVLGIKF